MHEILNAEAVEQLFALDDDDDDFSTNMLEEFAKQATECVEKMRADLKAGNFNDLSRAGHFLKGSSYTMGSVEIPDICAEIEHSPMLTLNVTLSKLSHAISRFLEEINRIKIKS